MEDRWITPEETVLTPGLRRMLWLGKQKSVWRTAELALFLLAMVGPWGFDRVHVPSEYACSAPWRRLEGELCWLPMRGTGVLSDMARAFINISAELVTGTIAPTDIAGESLLSLLLFPLVLPFFSTLLLILRGDGWHRQGFSVAAWGLAAGIGLLHCVASRLRLPWAVWGVWLYIGLAPSALILEVLTLAAARKASQR